MKIKTTLLSLILLLTAISSLAQPPNKDEAIFRSLIKQMTDAQVAYDAATLDKIFTADYTEISPIGDVDSREKVLVYYNAEAKLAAGGWPPKLELTDFFIRSYDKFAIVILRVNYTLMSEGQPLPPRGMRMMSVIKKEKGGWKIASTQYTIMRGTPPVPPKQASGN